MWVPLTWVIQIAPFTSLPFKYWWSEWQEHLFYLSASNYCKNFDADYQEPEDEVHTPSLSNDQSFSFFLKVIWQAPSAPSLTMSRSNRPIAYAPSSENPLIGHSALSLDDIMSGMKRKPSSTKIVTRKPPVQGSSSQQILPPITSSLVQVTGLLIVDILDSSPSNQLSLLILVLE